MTQKQKPEESILPPLEEIADAILKLSQAGEAIRRSRLNEKAVVMLLSEMSNVKRSDVKIILHNLPLLAREYLK